MAKAQTRDRAALLKAIDLYYPAYSAAFDGRKSTANAYISKGNAQIKKANAAVKTVNAETTKVNKVTNELESTMGDLGQRLASATLVCEPSS